MILDFSDMSKDNDRYFELRLMLSGRDLEAVAREEKCGSHGAGGVSVRRSWEGGLFTSDS